MNKTEGKQSGGRRKWTNKLYCMSEVINALEQSQGGKGAEWVVVVGGGRWWGCDFRGGDQKEDLSDKLTFEQRPQDDEGTSYANLISLAGKYLRQKRACLECQRASGRPMWLELSDSWEEYEQMRSERMHGLQLRILKAL